MVNKTVFCSPHGMPLGDKQTVTRCYWGGSQGIKLSVKCKVAHSMIHSNHILEATKLWSRRKLSGF